MEVNNIHRRMAWIHKAFPLQVCLAVWQATAASSLPGKVIGVFLPISAFVAMGFEQISECWTLLWPEASTLLCACIQCHDPGHIPAGCWAKRTLCMSWIDCDGIQRSLTGTFTFLQQLFLPTRDTACWWFFSLAVANMFMIPLGIAAGADLTMQQFFSNNLIPVTLGNLIGGALCVATPYAIAYGRKTSWASTWNRMLDLSLRDHVYWLFWVTAFCRSPAFLISNYKVAEQQGNQFCRSRCCWVC